MARACRGATRSQGRRHKPQSRQNGRVVLAAALDTQARAQIQNKQSILPLDVFLDAPVAGWGIAETEARGSIARRYFLGDEMRPSLPWVAATVAGAPITRHPRAQPPDTWLNYYGSALALPHLSFCEVTNYPPGYFRGKSVFVGARPKTLKAMEEADVFQTPHARWGGELFPGVEIGATAYLNLLHDDGLKQIPWPLQCLFIAALGLLLGAVLSPLRPLPASLAAVGAFLTVLALVAAIASARWWFAWPVIAFVQIPCALA